MLFCVFRVNLYYDPKFETITIKNVSNLGFP